jgi:hypothetical protein
MDPRILEKIRKCLAMANDGRGDITEAATALRQAQALMAKYNVTEQGLAAATIGEEFVRSKVSLTKPAQWEVSLFSVVTRAFGCDLMWRGSRTGAPTDKGYYVVIGAKHNVEIAVYGVASLQRQLLRDRAAFVARNTYGSKGEKTKSANAYCLAWVHAVSKVVAVFVDPDGANKKAIEAFHEQRKARLDKEPEPAKLRKTSTDGESYAMNRGLTDGEQAQLHRGVGGTDTGRLRLGA